MDKRAAAKLDIECEKNISERNLETIKCLADALEVLTALERAPEHQDTHPGHNIRTGNGYAHNHRVSNDTMPTLLAHINYLASEVDDRLDVLFERLEIEGSRVD
jgi:hypothetical protein